VPCATIGKAAIGGGRRERRRRPRSQTNWFVTFKMGGELDEMVTPKLSLVQSESSCPERTEGAALGKLTDLRTEGSCLRIICEISPN
jgi:hypothetical protein